MTIMKKNKLFLVLSVVTLLVIGLSTAAFAATDYKTPAEIVAGLTGKTVDEATADRQDGTSYGAQAQDADKLDEFQTERLEMYKQYLDQAVLDGKLTQAEADKLLEEMDLRMEDCDGTGTGICDGTGAGQNSERGNGTGMGMGMGRGAGNGTGTGFGNGACGDQDLT